MLRRILSAVAGVIFIFPGSEIYAEHAAKIDPIAQVYEVQGDATVKRYTDGERAEIKKGILLGRDDVLTLKKGASVGLYFKGGGKKEFKAEKESITSKIYDLLPKREAYERRDLTFGATRGINVPEVNPDTQAFFYPQETVIINSPPLIELAVFNGSDQDVRIPRAVINVLEKDRLLDSREVSSLMPDTTYTWFPEKLARGKEYSIEVQLAIEEIPDMAIVFTSDFYVADIPDKSAVSQYKSFGASVYRSFESTSTDYLGKTYKFWFLKRLKFEEDKNQPIISIEIFIK